MSNMGLEKYLNDKLKLSVKRTSVGDINVINQMKKSKSLIGGEQSGHIIISNYSTTGDGILAALKITQILSSSINKPSKLFNLYKDFVQQKFNLKCINKNQKLIQIVEKLRKNKEFNNANIRSLVRFSGTEPLIRILVEGKDKNRVKQKSILIKNLIKDNLGK